MIRVPLLTAIIRRTTFHLPHRMPELGMASLLARLRQRAIQRIINLRKVGSTKLATLALRTLEAVNPALRPQTQACRTMANILPPASLDTHPPLRDMVPIINPCAMPLANPLNQCEFIQRSQNHRLHMAKELSLSQAWKGLPS